LLRQSATFFLIAGILTGCTSSSSSVVVQSSPGTFTLSKEGAGQDKLQADAVQEARDYCIKNQREALLIGARQERNEYVLNSYTADVNFRCVATQSMREATKAAVLECRDRRLNLEFKTYRQSAECSNPRIMAAFQGADYPYLDLVKVLLDARLVAAENLDNGAITEAQAQTQSTELENRLTSEDQRRRSAAAVSQAAQATSDPQAFLQGLSAFQPAKRPPGKRRAVQRTALACNTTGFGGALNTTSCY
jgi:hypothetical protein